MTNVGRIKRTSIAIRNYAASMTDGGVNALSGLQGISGNSVRAQQTIEYVADATQANLFLAK
ncbi:hypothetical protein DLR11_12120 [Salmonella enterica subsp. salamae]|uniref:Uncharacterized protein n=2 Tax=Salmonella enterica subsp. salamae TaxID=59202 RepID=A0A6C7C7S6_SALER|nr:hypothetical protein [Salmonella enterica]ECC1481435.1 hypothetical protein [Salmonella enterica subsp. salamae]EHM1749747.1 hypothetical protein [Salmonella enterica subsp. salamae serovar 40:c:e,n,x,z15]HCM1999857.1 hypothetical protein [Salmonella enterica subsp. salamae serovar [1],40:z35:e,n,x,z15]ASG89048.1 hypothetical protein LFZ47_16600 [Salmonella enterica subsp. salamae serovar 55:k:z39 str. 1315K]ECC1655400.1 hypothetical protein [Salmonella enterica subsp. salamae]